MKVVGPSLRDARLHVSAILLTLQALGQSALGFRVSIAQILLCLALGAGIEVAVALARERTLLWPASGLLTGNSTALILRVPTTHHGQWWSLDGAWIFAAVVAVSMASKYVLRWRGRHIFNPSNLGLVLAFVALGPKYTEPLDLWWAPLGPPMVAAYGLLAVGGLAVGWELGMLSLEIGFLAGFAGFAALALLAVPDHCMVAAWQSAPMCGAQLWQTLVTSPEILLFGLFMVPDPRTVPQGPLARPAFGLLVAVLAVLLLGPTSLEFWTKTAILASLVVACAGRFALARLLTPLEEHRMAGWRLAAAAGAALLLIEALPFSAYLSTHGTDPVAGRVDASQVAVSLQAGSGPAPGGWLDVVASTSLPAAGAAAPAAASDYVWRVPDLPQPSIADSVKAFQPDLTPATASSRAGDVLLDLMIESEARRTHDPKLAAAGATDLGLQEFVDVINQDVAARTQVQKTYSIDRVGLNLYLPKLSTQASRLVGVDLHGTATITVFDASGHQLSKTTAPYAKTWGLGDPGPSGGHRLIINDYSDLAAVQ